MRNNATFEVDRANGIEIVFESITDEDSNLDLPSFSQHRSEMRRKWWVIFPLKLPVSREFYSKVI